MSVNIFKRRVCQLKCAFLFYAVYIFSKFYRKEQNYWLIAERGNDARDNGYVFYKYLKNSHPEIPVKFVITDDSPDRKRIDECDVIKYGSLKHYYLYITAPMLLSTHYQGYSPNFELFSQLDRRNLISVKGKKILLDHCVRMGKAGCTKDTVKIDMMVCSIPKEYYSLSENAGYEEGILRNIGMPRFDNLFHAIGRKPKNQILFMPTWRVKYTNASKQAFMADEYYRTCKEILESDRLNAFLVRNDLYFVFYPHIEMQKYIHLFQSKFERIQIKCAGNAVVEDLLIESQILITDYSSVFFDFAYMIKPVIYLHFDNSENEAMKNKRWFDFERDGVGPVCSCVDDMITTLETMDLFLPTGKYLEHIEKLFETKDDHNSERVFDAICRVKK